MNILIAIFALFGGTIYIIMMNLLFQLAGILTYSTLNVLIGVGIFLVGYLGYIIYQLGKTKNKKSVKEKSSPLKSTPIHYQHASKRV